MVDRYFEKYALEDQDILGHKETLDKVLALVPEDILFICCLKHGRFPPLMHSKYEISNMRYCIIIIELNCILHLFLLLTSVDLNSMLTCKKRSTAGIPEGEET